MALPRLCRRQFKRRQILRSFQAIEQIAGDEFHPGNLEALTATGFCRNGPSNDNNVKPPAREQYRLDQLDDTLSTATSVFLGLTVGCARCHDHLVIPSNNLNTMDY